MSDLKFTGHIKKLDFDAHGDVYDWAMANSSDGDFLELSNGDIVYMLKAWPVLVLGDNNENVLHAFVESDPTAKTMKAEVVSKFHELRANLSKTPSL